MGASKINNHVLQGPVTVDWGIGEGEVDVYWRPASLADIGRHECAMEVSSAEAAAVAILNRARDSEGRHMFSEGKRDRRAVENDFSLDAIQAVYTAMNAAAGSEPEPGN